MDWRCKSLLKSACEIWTIEENVAGVAGVVDVELVEPEGLVVKLLTRSILVFRTPNKNQTYSTGRFH